MAAFLLGSVPTGVVIARTRGLNLREFGSGNIGATNVLRAMGKGPAFLTLAGDFLKGLVPVMTAMLLNTGIIYSGVVGIAAILGHVEACLRNLARFVEEYWRHRPGKP